MMRFISSVNKIHLAAALLLLGPLLASPASAIPATNPASATDSTAAPAPAQPDFIQARQFQWANARIPGRFSAHQNVTAWQVTRGSWAGETLDGLNLVLVQSSLESNAGQRLVNCYVSSQATLAQRQALVSAFMATQAGVLPAIDPSAMRVEPAVITLEINGQTVVLHLGLIA